MRTTIPPAVNRPAPNLVGRDGERGYRTFAIRLENNCRPRAEYKVHQVSRAKYATDDFLVSDDTTTSRQLRTYRVFETCHWTFMPRADLADTSRSLSLSRSRSIRSRRHSSDPLVVLRTPQERRYIPSTAAVPSPFDSRQARCPSLSLPRSPSPRFTRLRLSLSLFLPPPPVSPCVSDRYTREAAGIDERVALSATSHICRYAARVAPLYDSWAQVHVGTRDCFEHERGTYGKGDVDGNLRQSVEDPKNGKN